MSPLFTVEDRDRVRDWVLERAASDPRVVAGAEVGSLALGGGDRWSDLDLTFGIAADASVQDVLEDWSRDLVDEFDAAVLFDLPYGAVIYRVFLLSSALQVDLSFAPESEFGAHSPRFKLLFGQAVEKPHTAPPDASEVFGWAVHDAVRARFCVERSLPWQAEFLIGRVRDAALSLASLGHELPAFYGRGRDELPADVLKPFEGALVRSLDRDELLRALTCAVERLLEHAGDVSELAKKVEPQLREVTAH